MQNIKATGNKFLVEIKNDQGKYEPLGVLSFREATEIQFSTHRAIRMQRVSDIEQTEEPDDNGARVGYQLFTRGELRKDLNDLTEKVKSTMKYVENHRIWIKDGKITQVY